MKQVAAAAGLTVALAGIVGGVYIAQQPVERVELVQPASGEPTPVPVETTATVEPTAIPTTVAPEPVRTTQAVKPAPVESTQAPAPAPKKVTTVTKAQTASSDPAPAPTQPKPVDSGALAPGAPFTPKAPDLPIAPNRPNDAPATTTP